MSTTVSLTSIGAHGELLQLSGQEQLGALFRFEMTIACDDGALDLDVAVGGRAELSLDDSTRTLHGVLAELEQGECLDDGRFVYRAVLVPSLWLLSLGRRRRMFSDATTPEIVAAVLESSGLDCKVTPALREDYPRHRCVAQHRESDLDFVLRLLEREGITLLCDDSSNPTAVTLCDHNESLPMCNPVALGEQLDELRCKSRVLPRTVALNHHDPADPELPLQASARVAERGFGALDIDDVAFDSPEDGQRVARLYAERKRCAAKRFSGVARVMLRAGDRTQISGHARADFNRELTIVEAKHEMSNGGFCCRFSAIDNSTPFRPERTTPEPKIFGLMGGRVALREPGQRTAQRQDGRYQVKLAGGGSTERAMPLATPYASGREGLSFALPEGAPVVWGCIDGDPDRPIITAALPEHDGDQHAGDQHAGDQHAGRTPRARIRGGGATIEMSGASPSEVGAIEGQLAGAYDRAQVPPVAHYGDSNKIDIAEAASVTNSLALTDTWIRFGSPHSSAESSKPWSYLRIGEAATGSGNALSTTNAGSFKERKADCGDVKLEMNDYDATKLAGVFQFTDKNKTAITAGNNEEVIKGKSRIAIYENGSSPVYEQKVDNGRVETTAKTAAYEWGGSTKMEGMAGFKMENIFGGKLETLIGGKLGAELGFFGALTAGYKVDFTFADSYEYTEGADLGTSKMIDLRAKDRIQYSLSPPTSVDWTTVGKALPMVGAGVLAAGTAAVLAANPAKWSAGVNAAIYGACVGACVILARAVSKDRDLKDGDPILSLTKDDTGKKLATLRADDWWCALKPEFAVVGKNEKYSDLAEADKIDKTKTEAALMIEETPVNSKKCTLRIQAGKKNTKAEVILEDTKIMINGDDIKIA